MSKSTALKTQHQKTRMLKALEACRGNVSKASKATGITRQTHYNWFKEDNEYNNSVSKLRFECHEQFKDLIMDAVIKKIEQGNTAIIALCFKAVCMKNIENLESLNPFKERLKAVYKLVDHQSAMYAKDPDTARILSEIKEEGSNPRQRLDPFSPEGIRAYEEVLRRQREGK